MILEGQATPAIAPTAIDLFRPGPKSALGQNCTATYNPGSNLPSLRSRTWRRLDLFEFPPTIKKNPEIPDDALRHALAHLVELDLKLPLL